MTTRNVYAYFENSTTKIGQTGLGDVAFYIKSVKHSDSAIAVVVNGTVGFEVGYGVYGVQVADMDLETYDYVGAAQTASTAVTSKAVPMLRWDAAESHDAELAGLSTFDPATDTITLATLAAAAITSAQQGVEVSIIKYVDYSHDFDGLTISASWTKMWVTIKRNKLEADDQAVLQLVVTNTAAGDTDGVLYVMQAAASVAQRTQGSLTVDQAAGTVVMALVDDLTAVLTGPDKGNYYFDVKQLTASGTTQLDSGLVAISEPVTRAIA